MEYKPYILGINGSPYKDGIVVELLSLVLNAAEKEGAEIKTVHLYDLKSIRIGGAYSKDPATDTVANMPQDDITALYPEILRADGIVFATPVYWANMSAVMKDFIEHLSPLENDGFALLGKSAAFIAASKENEGGVEMAAMSMVAPITQMGVIVPPNAVMWYPSHWATSKGDHTGWAKEEAPSVGRNMVKLARLLKENPIHWGTGE